MSLYLSSVLAVHFTEVARQEGILDPHINKVNNNNVAGKIRCDFLFSIGKYMAIQEYKILLNIFLFFLEKIHKVEYSCTRTPFLN